MVILLHDLPTLRRATLTESELVRSQDISGDATISVLLFPSTWIKPIPFPSHCIGGIAFRKQYANNLIF